ncbi:hypothetical protein VWY73_06715 [Phaeobacter sp. JH20_12]
MAWLAMLTSTGVTMMVTVIYYVAYNLPIWGLLLLYSGISSLLGVGLTVALVLKSGGFPRRRPEQNSQDTSI